MSQFEGGTAKVRCIDCTRLVGTKCGVKKAKVSIKKRRSCSKYNFKGEYENSTPLPATYVPHVDKKTKQLMKKLMKLGVMPVDGQRPLVKDGPYGEQEQQVVNPAAYSTTATSQIPVVGDLEAVGEAAIMRVKDDESQEGTTVVWSPEDEESAEK